MAKIEEIKIVGKKDLGIVIARADHDANVIEINESVFPQMPPLMQDFILCHEVCHLQFNERDEARTNAMARDLFLHRASGKKDLLKRQEFLGYANESGKSNEIVTAIIGLGISLAGTTVSLIQANKKELNKLSASDQKKLAENYCKQAFESAELSSHYSAQDYFMQLMGPLVANMSYEKFIKKYTWFAAIRVRNEKKYGRLFSEVKKINYLKNDAVKVIFGVLVIVVAVLIYKLIKK